MVRLRFIQWVIRWVMPVRSIRLMVGAILNFDSLLVTIRSGCSVRSVRVGAVGSGLGSEVIFNGQ